MLKFKTKIVCIVWYLVSYFLKLIILFYFYKEEENIIDKRKARETQRVHGSEQRKRRNKKIEASSNLF